MEKECSVCARSVDSETAAILAMGGFGNPRYMCADCEEDFDTVTKSRDTVSISSAMNRIADKMSKTGLDDKLALKTVEEILKEAVERKKKIEAGEYDFSEEDAFDTEEEDSVPEELRETEEDIERERIRAEKYEKIDKITNWICIAGIVLAVGFMVYRIFF